MNATLYNEIANTHLFEMNRPALYNHARMFLTHYRELSPEEKEKRPDRPFLLAASSGFTEKIYLGNASNIARWEDLDESDVVINVLRFSGPIMRNGGACAYGSMELRDMIKRAADVKQCIGQIFIVDTPGGSSYSKFDFKEALDYAHSKGQITIMYVDGMLCSAGMAWGALCQKRYSHNEHCIFGCMGTYACFYTNKNGDVNTITQEMFHEVYAKDSPMKNKAFRDAAEGNDAMIVEEVTRSNQQYKEIIRSGLPKVTEEQLDGDVYEAKDVIGTLCDGIKTFDEVLNEMLQSAGIRMGNSEKSSAHKNQAPQNNMRKATGSAIGKKSTKEPNDDEPLDPDEPGDPNKPVDPNEPDNPDENPEEKPSKNSNKIMGKEYVQIRSILELEALESDKNNGLYLTEELADRLEKALDESGRRDTILLAKGEEIMKLNETIKTLRTEHESALETVKTKAALEVTQKEENFNQEKEKLESRISELEKTIAEQNTQLEQKDAEIAELGKKPAPQAHPATGAPEAGSKTDGVMLASKFKTEKEQREAHAKLMEQLKSLK